MNNYSDDSFKPKIDLSNSDWSQWFVTWIWHAVLTLVELKNFNPSPKWIAKRLNISVEQAVEAIEGLERLNLIRRDGESFKAVSDYVSITTEQLSRDELLSGHCRIVSQLLAKLGPHDLYTVDFVVADKEAMEKYGAQIYRLVKEMEKDAKNRGCTEVVGVQMSFMQLTNEE